MRCSKTLKLYATGLTNFRSKLTGSTGKLCSFDKTKWKCMQTPELWFRNRQTTSKSGVKTSLRLKKVSTVQSTTSVRRLHQTSMGLSSYSNKRLTEFRSWPNRARTCNLTSKFAKFRTLILFKRLTTLSETKTSSQSRSSNSFLDKAKIVKHRLKRLESFKTVCSK